VVIGLDFDNTIASYDRLMHRLAHEWGWVEAGFAKNKRLVRDALRALPDGERKWRRLQTHCYGLGMGEARPMDGVKPFLETCRRRGVPVWIVSHKTEFANFGDPTVNLRAAAMEWLSKEQFLEEKRFGLSRERVFFEDTREAKIERIRSLGISHFVDDLEETFLEKTFPAEVAQILYAPQPVRDGKRTWRAFGTWAQIDEHLFGHERA
jgi:hypothetical protein